MDFNKLSEADKKLVLLAAAVIVGGLAGVADGWGSLATIGLLAGIGVVGVIFQPQLMPTLKVPIARNQLIFGLAVAAVVCFVLAGLGGLSFLFDFTSIATLLFDIGIVASLVLAWFAWLDFKVANPEVAARIAAATRPAAGDAAPAPVASAPTPMPAAPEPEPVVAPEPEPVVAMEPETAQEMTDTAAMNEPAAGDDTPDASVEKPAGG
jgi:hypothetical protein